MQQQLEGDKVELKADGLATLKVQDRLKETLPSLKPFLQEA